MKKKKVENFWNKEYTTGEHLALSTDPSEDMVKFFRYLEREYNGAYLGRHDSILDLGCGNGRNLHAISEEYGCHGIGYDTSIEAISQAEKLKGSLPLTYEVRSIKEPIPLTDESQSLVLDMMVSHFLNKDERETLRKDIARVLRPQGWFFFKTFLLDGDRNAYELLRKHPGSETNSYIHPTLHAEEHVYTEEEIIDCFSPYFTIHKIHKSHGHLRGAAKRRSVSVYMQKKD